jgi:peptidoglycan/xylan/chitin deacetylase (PgdA/CDA1 family)
VKPFISLNQFQSKYYIAKLISSILRGIITSNGCRILMYHSLRAVVDGDFHGIYQMNKISFQMQMDYLASLNKRIIPLRKWTSNQESLVITFDDGYLDTLEIAAPILSSHNMPFTVFVAPYLVKSKDQRYLDEVSLLELSKIDGCNIGAHGFHHCHLTKCTDKELKDELQKSKIWLEDLLSVSVESMSYPYGAVDRRVCDAVDDAGYKIATTSRYGANQCESENLLLRRTDIWSVDDISVFQSKINGHWDWLKYF